jgi:dTDP-4-amino-4,6-dideoxygalactose transaminase
VHHLYVIRVADRDALIEHLHKAGIGTGIHYPIPLHLQKAYAGMNYGARAFPVAERMAREIVSLPMFPQLTPAQQARIADEIRAFLRQRTAATELEEAAPIESAAGSV